MEHGSLACQLDELKHEVGQKLDLAGGWEQVPSEVDLLDVEELSVVRIGLLCFKTNAELIEACPMTALVCPHFDILCLQLTQELGRRRVVLEIS